MPKVLVYPRSSKALTPFNASKRHRPGMGFGTANALAFEVPESSRVDGVAMLPLNAYQTY